MKRSQRLKVHLVQMNSVDDVATNLSTMKAAIHTIPAAVSAEGDAAHQLICFPENCLYFRILEGTAVHSFDLTEELWREFAELAKAKNAVLHLGSIAHRQGGVVRNTSVVVSPDTSVRATYSKIHLFDIELEGHKPIRESDVFAHGADAVVLQVGDWTLGQSICYDLRFSELYHRYAALEVDAILVPSAFLSPTGEAHWEVLLRARAIESQAFVLAAAQSGRHLGVQGGERSTYGHSMVVNPWGLILGEASVSLSPGTAVLSVTLERESLEKVRRQIPMKNHRRLR